MPHHSAPLSTGEGVGGEAQHSSNMYFNISTNIGTHHYFEEGYLCRIENPRKAVARDQANAVMLHRGHLIPLAIIANLDSFIQPFHYEHHDRQQGMPVLEKVEPIESAALGFYERAYPPVAP